MPEEKHWESTKSKKSYLNYMGDGVAKLPRPRPASRKRASRPAPKFMVLFLSIKAIFEIPVGSGFRRCWADEQSKNSTRLPNYYQK